MNKFVEYCLDRVYILQQATLKNCHRWAVEEMYKLVYMWLTVGYLSLLISVIWQNALLYYKTLEKIGTLLKWKEGRAFESYMYYYFEPMENIFINWYRFTFMFFV